MIRYIRACTILLIVLGSVRASEPVGVPEPLGRPKPLQERWDIAILNGAKAGFVHTSVQQVTEAGQELLQTTVELNLTVKRFSDTARLRMITGSTETRDGHVTGVMMRQFLGKNQEHLVTGTVDGNVLHIHAGGARPYDKDIPWNGKVVGLYRQEQLYREHHIQPGDEFSYLSYEPTVTAVVRTSVRAKDYEEVEIDGSESKQRLLRVDVVTDKIMGVQLPPLAVWLDANLLPVRSEVDMPGLGKLRLNRATRDEALRPAGPFARTTNIGLDQLIKLNRRIPRPYDTDSAVYRITIKGDDDPGTTFAQDARQQVRNVQGNTFELHVHALREPDPTMRPRPARPEYLESCYFISSDDRKVRELARKAVGTETDPWEKAKRIEGWVFRNMRDKNFSENFAPASHVARTLQGDCTEHALLSAAMCRSVNVPSRTAVGLVYVENGGLPAFGYHMWTEVWVRGQWMPIDATLGRGYVGASHLKILDHSWHDVHSFTPLLPLVRVVGKASIEVLRSGAAEVSGAGPRW